MWVIQGQAPENEAHFFADILEPLCVSISCYEDPERSLWFFEGLVTEVPNLSFFQEKIQQAGESYPFDVPRLTYHFLPQCDWLAENYKAFPPLQIGPFYFYGSHHKDPPPPDTHPLWIDAATAFGSGHHASTTGCLALLSTYMNQNPSPHILDLGCGSGILAMAAARLAPQASILAVDNDPEAITVSQENIRRNHLKEQITVKQSEGFAGIPSNLSFDLILANILEQPLLDLATDIATFTKPHGEIILSGFLENQSPRIHKRYTDQGFQLINEQKESEWTTLRLKYTKKSTPL